MPVVGAHRGTYFSYITCWAWAQAAWHGPLRPLLDALPPVGALGPGGLWAAPAVPQSAAASPKDAAATGDKAGLVATRERLRTLMRLSARLSESELLAVLGNGGRGAPEAVWAPPLPEDMGRWFDFPDS
jgi:hypothetical protein